MSSEPKPSPPPLKVFISYSHEDEKRKADIVKALRQSGDAYDILSDELLKGGDDWDAVLTQLRSEAEVFLLLVSPAWLGSEKAMQLELPQILERAESGGAVVVPVILRTCKWNDKPFGKYQAVPRFGRPISRYENINEAYQEIVHAMQSLDDLRIKPEAAARVADCKGSESLHLDLSNFGLRRIPRDLLLMPWLTTLNLSGNFIDVIENLDELKKLQHLNLSFNSIEKIAGIEPLRELTQLNLDSNVISEITNLETVTKLRRLTISFNRISSLNGIEHLQQLEVILAEGNELTEVTELNQLPWLRCVSLINNRIKSLRPLLPHLKRGLEVNFEATVLEGEPIDIFLSGNPVIDPSPEVVAVGTEAIIDYFAKIDLHGEKELEVLKLILIGNSGVGKTNFSQFLRGKKLSGNHQSTDTLEIQNLMMPVTIDGKKRTIRVNVFDFGGQDYYHDLHRLYYSYDTAYVLLWDKASNRYSEQTEQLPDGTSLIYEDFPLEYWLESIRYNLEGKQAQPRRKPASGESAAKKETPGEPAEASTDVQVAVAPDISITAPVLVLQNKIDLGAGLLNQISLHEKYPNIAGFFSVSLSAGKRLKVLQDVLQDCLARLDLAGRTLVSYQHEVIEQYLQSSVEFEVLSLEEFRERCAAMVPAHQQQFDTTDAKTVAGILTNLGVVFYDDSAGEDGVVITQIGGLNDQIKKIMSLAKGGSDKGIFRKSDIMDIPHVENILPMLLRSQFILRLDAEQFLVPQFLPVTPDAQTAHFIRAFKHCQIRYVYTAYFHKTLLVGMFARFLNRIDDTPQDDSDAVQAVSYWRNGLILSQGSGDETKMVFIHFIKETATCRIEIRSLYPFERTGLEREVEKELDLINKGWTVRKEVSVNSEDFFSVDDMIGQVKENDFVFRKGHNVFTVNDFKYLVNFEKVPKKLFISYSSKDAEFVKRFWTHLNVLKAKGYIEPWYDRKIEPGAKWDDSIRKEMQSADLVVFLLSPDFLATSYIMDVELKHAMDMADQGHCGLFFIQLLHCSWSETVLDRYQMLLNPPDAGKIQSFINTPGNDEGWKTYIESLTEKVKS